MSQELTLNGRDMTEQELTWAVDVTKAHMVIGRVLTEMDTMTDGILPYETAGFKTLHEYAKALLGIETRQTNDTLSQYKKFRAYIQIATPQQIMQIQNKSVAMYSAIKKDTEPTLAIEALILSSSAKEVKDNLRKLAVDRLETEEKLKQQQLELDKEAKRIAKEQEEHKAKQDKIDKEKQEERDRREKERDKLLDVWKKNNKEEYTELRKQEEPQQVEVDNFLFDIPNDLHEEYRKRVHYEWEDNYSGATFDELTEDECEAIQAIEEQIVALHTEATNIFINYTSSY